MKIYIFILVIGSFIAALDAQAIDTLTALQCNKECLNQTQTSANLRCECTYQVQKVLCLCNCTFTAGIEYILSPYEISYNCTGKMPAVFVTVLTR